MHSKIEKILYKIRHRIEYNAASIKDYGHGFYKLTVINALSFEHRESKGKGTVNEEKLACNLRRAKNKVFDYAMCNDFENFVTLTIDKQKYDRTDLKKYHKDLSQFIRDYNKKYCLKIKYILIPEMHKDGESWHMHGLIKGLPKSHLSVNKNGFYDWRAYSVKFGYMSIDVIRDRKAVAAYITKYITKALQSRAKDLNARTYYCSQGLKLPAKIKEGNLVVLPAFISFDYKNDYVSISWITEEQYKALEPYIFEY